MWLNVVIENDLLWPDDCKTIFGSEGAYHVPPMQNTRPTDMLDLLVRLGSFTSRGQAKKSWRGPTVIPLGFSEFKVGKKFLFIWNPTPWPTEQEVIISTKEKCL